MAERLRASWAVGRGDASALEGVRHGLIEDEFWAGLALGRVVGRSLIELVFGSVEIPGGQREELRKLWMSK